MPRIWLVAPLAFLAMAAPAHGGGTLVTQDTRPVWAGPEFAGDRIAWATLAHGDVPPGVEAHLAAPDGTGRTTRTLAESPIYQDTHTSVSLAATDRRLAASVHIGSYTSRKGGYFQAHFSRVLAGPFEGPFEQLGVPCAGEPYLSRALAADGDAVAYVVCGSRVVVRDLAAQKDHVFPKASQVSLAGSFLATFDYPNLIVWNWRTGEARWRLPVPVESFDVQDDGTIAYRRRDGDRFPVDVASPAAPVPRTIAESSSGRVRIARDRVAFGGAGGGIAVRGVDGSAVAESPTGAVADFDGDRVTWSTRPCALTAIATWDLVGAAPAMPQERCPLASLTSTTLRARTQPTTQTSYRHERISIELACQPEPALGCAGFLGMYALDSRRKFPGRMVDMVSTTFALMPGERRVFDLPYGQNRVCIAGRNGLRPVVEISRSSFTAVDARMKRRRVRVVGLDKAIRACSS